ncbi:F5/8 type C domain containing protein [Tritrichomonas foetus]|uniref:F5/8 type C domain containing protein n=1 Tax=Tritrichomonas foetus TaxID=1144522 RepID=A0A1J4K7H1_9EUKA|nr:F5/8 type C domain containing protein [Tritrichomonas foetus]|eukprot:OHT05646.1 F5/8 type C domain containing protein [Tritrichomonas foetus]
MNGIISYLTGLYKGNIMKQNIINIEASSCGGGNISCLVSDDVEDNFYTDDEKNAWVLFDFKTYRVRITDYSIKTYDYNKDNNHLKNWVLEVSNNKSDWEIIDTRSNDSSLNRRSVCSSFEINQPNNNNENYRFIRIRLTGKNWKNLNYLVFYSIEFYGHIKGNYD